MAQKAETKLVKKIREALDEHYPGFYFKSHGGPYQITGLPDLIGVYRGRFIGIEVKRPGEEDKLTQIQQRRIREINRHGGVAFMATSPEEVLTKLKEALPNGQKEKGRK